MRYLTLAIAVALLSGCLFSNPGSSRPVKYLYTVDVAGLNQNVTVSWSAVTFDLIVSGTNATVTVAPNQRIRQLTISGPSADVFIGSTTTVSRTVTLSGTNSVLHLPAGSPISVNTTGVGSIVVYDSSAG